MIQIPQINLFCKRIMLNRAIAMSLRGLTRRITLNDGRVCVFEDNENFAAEKTVVFMPGACGSLETDFKVV